MTNNPTRAIPTVEDIKIVADAIEEYPRSGEARCDAIRMLRAIADQMRKSEPVAWRFKPPKLETWAITQHAFDPVEVKLSKCVVEPLYTSPLADAEDARRYRWLRQRVNVTDGQPFIARWHGCASVWTGEEADKTIDAAMKEDSHD